MILGSMSVLFPCVALQPLGTKQLCTAMYFYHGVPALETAKHGLNPMNL